MNDSKIVQNMITFVESIEGKIKASKLGNTNTKKSQAVTNIMKELEREIKNADQDH